MQDKINQLNSEGQKHGPWEGYYKNGQLKYIGTFNNGRRVGLWKWCYENGTPNQIRFYAR
jgi:antitoxin component YwqK of YwqJK toxin-antitoxin module